ncbi:hypothetical protein AgCh_015943 [Apium graveolens]
MRERQLLPRKRPKAPFCFESILTTVATCHIDIARKSISRAKKSVKIYVLVGNKKPNGLRSLDPRPNGKPTGNRLLLALGMSADEAQPQKPKASPRLRDFMDKASPWPRITLGYQLFV